MIKKIIIVILLCFSCQIFAKTFTSPILFDNNDEWYQLELNVRFDTDSITIINWSGFGGTISMADEFADYISRLQASGRRIIFNVVGIAASAHANVICKVSNVYIDRGGYLLFHSAFIPIRGRKIYTDTATREELQPCVDRNILSSADVDMIITFRIQVIVDRAGNKHIRNDG